jgi:hypothetical protein
VLDDRVQRGLQRPEFLIVDGAAGLDKTIAAMWGGVPVQRGTAHKQRNPSFRAPCRLETTVAHRLFSLEIGTVALLDGSEGLLPGGGLKDFEQIPLAF